MLMPEIFIFPLRPPPACNLLPSYMFILLHNRGDIDVKVRPISLFAYAMDPNDDISKILLFPTVLDHAEVYAVRFSHTWAGCLSQRFCLRDHPPLHSWSCNYFERLLTSTSISQDPHCAPERFPCAQCKTDDFVSRHIKTLLHLSHPR
jgi:hypothetical protein